MSIDDAVNAYCATGVLYKVQVPLALASVERRTVCVSQKLQPLIRGPWFDEGEYQFALRIQAHLFGFIEEELITVRQGPPAKDDAQLVRLDPHDVFEVRCINAGPSIRMFGCIAARDLFVAFHWKYFNWLGRFGSPQWQAAIEECKADWCALFPFIAPVTGGVFPDDYVSGAIPASDL